MTNEEDKLNLLKEREKLQKEILKAIFNIELADASKSRDALALSRNYLFQMEKELTQIDKKLFAKE